MDVYERQTELINALLHREVYAHDVVNIELIETHISWVILTGRFAYKIKKPVDLGFLDFSTLQKRRHCCEEELRLNRRLAPDIYLDVITITGTEKAPVLSNCGNAIEYAVKMLQFPQEMQLDHMLERGELSGYHIDSIARMIADFHRVTDIAGYDSNYGSPDSVYTPVAENFSQIRNNIKGEQFQSRLASLEQWSSKTHRHLISVFEKRKRNGFVRECHGDMHLRNLVWYQDAPLAFDCIEFNPALRWIDVISEIAFLFMDLQDRQQPGLAQQFLNSYLEQGGDYDGVMVLPFYCCYRALVRAKVSAIRLSQPDISKDEHMEVCAEFAEYLDLAESYQQQGNPKLIITRGLSASGKSTLSQQLLERMAALRIRSDVERKRLFGIDANDNKGAPIETGIYSADASEQTYCRLAELAAHVLDAGFNVIIDAANLRPQQYSLFQRLAEEKHVNFVILELVAPADTLRQRIKERGPGVSDADLSVLEHQLLHYKPLEKSATRYLIAVDTEKPIDIDAVVKAIGNANMQ